MTTDFAQVRIEAPQTGDGMVVTHVYAADMALVGQAVAGDPIAVPPGTGYLANALAPSGAAVSIPARFDVPEGTGSLDIRLVPRGNSKPSIASDAPAPWILFRAKTAPETTGAGTLASPFGLWPHESGASSTPRFSLFDTTLDLGRSPGSDDEPVIVPSRPIGTVNQDPNLYISGPQPAAPTGGANSRLAFLGSCRFKC